MINASQETGSSKLSLTHTYEEVEQQAELAGQSSWLKLPRERERERDGGWEGKCKVHSGLVVRLTRVVTFSRPKLLATAIDSELGANWHHDSVTHEMGNKAE